jgi:hypothetical protein
MMEQGRLDQMIAESAELLAEARYDADEYRRWLAS